jgi:hypothetical protein
VAIQPGHTLVKTGIYGIIRHPSYLGLLVNSLGWAFVFRAGVGFVLTALMIPPLLARIHAHCYSDEPQRGDDPPIAAILPLARAQAPASEQRIDRPKP